MTKKESIGKQMSRISEISHGRFPAEVYRNAAPAKLYERAVLFDGGNITKSGGLAAKSGKKTGRSPRDKRIVSQASCAKKGAEVAL